METRVDEIAEDVYRISTYMPEIAPPAGFTFNQFVIDADEPLLYHTGMRQLFPVVREAVERVVPMSRLRWIAFAHVESDECGAMNEFLGAAPHAEVAHGMVGCTLSLNDLCDRPPRALGGDEVLELGGRTVRRRARNIETPHVPHNWESRVLFEETTRTLFCGDLGTHLGGGEPVRSDDFVEEALGAEAAFRQISCLSASVAALRTLAGLEPRTLALMHGRSFSGDGGAALRALADGLESRFSPEAEFAARTSVLAHPMPA